jgi:hypothetical protein
MSTLSDLILAGPFFQAAEDACIKAGLEFVSLRRKQGHMVSITFILTPGHGYSVFCLDSEIASAIEKWEPPKPKPTG